ncbi:MAG: rhodanese-like domain-containing protein [Proteobacteria bacterium]|nr:rhodanese-like domain-containing protein [Pseudomonadota bacterium]
MKMLKTMLLPILLIAAILVPAVYAVESSTGNSPVIIDVRTEAEWAAGHLDGAVLIPYERIGAEISKVAADKKETIFLYCRTGRRSGIAEETLKNAGYHNLTNLKTVENASKVLSRDVVK